MKFDARTIQILRNFSTINEGLIFKQGNRLKTISSTKSIMASAVIEPEIEATFAIGELGQFLSALSLFEEPELTVHDRTLDIRGGMERMTYVLADQSVILAPPEKDIRVPDPEVRFTLKNEVLSRVLKAMSIVSAPEIAVVGDGDKIYIETHDGKHSARSTYRAEVGETDKKFCLVFMAENLKLLPGDYEVAISSRGLSHFSSGEQLEYWIAIEAHSTYDG